MISDSVAESFEKNNRELIKKTEELESNLITSLKNIELLISENSQHSAKKISDSINEGFENNNRELIIKIDELESKLLKSLNSIEILKSENSQNRKQIVYLETVLKDIYDSSVIEKKICPICNSQISAFLPFGDPLRENALCPNCGSLERHRGSYLFLKEKTNILEENIKMLHFAPENFFREIFSKKENIEYFPVDLNPKVFHLKESTDIQDLQFPDDTFDFIYCSHILEHVPHDQQAIKELYRVLKPNGAALIMVPLKPSLKETYEDKSMNTPELRQKHYGQSDHLRLYGSDFQGKLENSGFNVSNDFREKIDEKSVKKYGLKSYRDFFYCNKKIIVKK